MDTALIIVIAVVVLLLLFFVARRAWGRSIEARREKAGELRVESTRDQERARRAEIEAERRREAADTRQRRADRIDPDVGGSRRGWNPFRRNRDDENVDAEESARR